MDAKTYSFQIGEFACLVINDGTHAYPDPARLFFANASREQLVPVLSANGINLDEWKDREDEGILYVPKAGEILYRMK